MGCTYKALINKDNRVNKGGKYSFCIRITVDRKSKYFNTGEKIGEDYWSGKDKKLVKDAHQFAFEINALIRRKLHLLMGFEYKQKSFGNGISLDSISEFYHKNADPNVFNEYVSEFMKNVKGKSFNTLKKYRTFERYLNEFNCKINFSQLNEPMFQTFALWLQQKGLVGVTVYKYTTHVKMNYGADTTCL